MLVEIDNRYHKHNVYIQNDLFQCKYVKVCIAIDI